MSTETNGGGRLDRIEALLASAAEKMDRVATMGYLHDERISRIEANIEQMQEDEAAYRKEQHKRDAALDKRIADLVSAIGELISRTPPPARV